MVSTYRNSRICPLHSEELQFTNGPKLAQCPRGHRIHRDVTSPLNMLRKAVEEKRVGKVAKAIKEALDAITIEALEEWTKLLEQETCHAEPAP
jgi:putative transposase